MQIRNERKQEQKELQRNETNIEHKTIKADFLDTDATVSVF